MAWSEEFGWEPPAIRAMRRSRLQAFLYKPKRTWISSRFSGGDPASTGELFDKEGKKKKDLPERCLDLQMVLRGSAATQPVSQ